MDAATAQQLAGAIQVLAMAAAAIPPAALAADTLTSPYEGGPLDLASWHGSSLLCDGALALGSKFTRRVNALQVFLADQDKSQNVSLGPSNSWYPDDNH